MAKGLVTDTYLTDIADAIRTKNGTETQYKPSEMANAISNIKTKFKINDLKFRDYKGTVLDLSFLDTSDVTDMSHFFRNCTNLVQLNISNWDTSSVTTMDNMFYSCDSLTNLDLSNWDTSSVTTMDYVFHSCNSLTNLDLSNWDTSSVTNMQCTFSYCEGITNLDLSNWDTSSVTTMYQIFNGCSSLTGLNISNWNTSSVTDMQGMFYRCGSLTGLNISNWDTSSVTTMRQMFSDCSSLTELDLSNWDTSSVTDTSRMFYNCSSLTKLDLSNWDTSNVTDVYEMFEGCTKLEMLDLSNWDITSFTTSFDMFNNCGSDLSTPTTVYVKDETVQQWILDKTSYWLNWSTANVIIKNNLLSLSEDNAEYVTFEGSGATVAFNPDNTLTVSADGTSGWGVNIAQPNLTLEAGKTYTLSCNNMLDSTWISLNNEQDMMIRRSVASKEFTPASNIVNPTVVIWVSGGVVYDNVKWNIKLTENI